MKFGQFIVLALFLISSISIVEVNASIVVEYFYHPDCRPCIPKTKLVRNVFPEYGASLKVEWRDMRFNEANERFIAYELSRRPAIVFNHDPETAIYNITEDRLRADIEYYLATSANLTDGDAGLDSFPNGRMPDLTLPLVIVSGLVDGINPCAFSLLIFFLSFLFNIKRSRANVLGMGSLYILGIFVGYLALGLGLLSAISIPGLMHPFALLSIFLLTLMGGFQIREAISFGPPLFKVPGIAVQSIQKLVKRSTMPFALLLGILVSICEFPCSGGVYVGILVLLASSPHFVNGLFYLVLYNLMFIVPLVVILIVASSTDALLKMDRWRVMSRRKMKLMSGVFLISLAALTWYIIFQLPHH